MIAPAILSGQTESHLCAPDEAARLGAPVHRDLVVALDALRAAGREAGFDLAIDSGFRSFERQRSIWNRKASGQLAVLDSESRPLDIAALSPRDLAFAILRWSALPGASRHHWGTDLDVFDAAARPPGYEVRLVPSEVEDGGLFAPLHDWLDERIASGTSYGFFRPYDRDRGGVAAERWHLSFAPIAVAAQRAMSAEFLRGVIQPADILLKNAVLEHLDEIVARFVVNTNADWP